MPTYEYACKSCGEHLEVVQSFKDDALTVCPNCGGELVARPRRPAGKLIGNPASTTRVFKPGCAMAE